MKVKDIQTLCMKCMKYGNYIVGDGVAYCREHFDERMDERFKRMSERHEEYFNDIQGGREDMNKKIGDKGKAVCSNCGTIKDITYKNSYVPLSDGGGIIEHILVGVCDDCASVVLIPHQSTSKIGEYLRG